MNETEAYIETGTLELYVLGQLSADEEQEVEAMAAKYPEIREEISDIEMAMEKYALMHAITPVSDLAEQIFSNTKKEIEAEALKIIPPSAGYESKLRTLRYALVACIALLIVSTAALFSAHTKLNVAEEQIVSLSEEKEKFASRASFMQENNNELQKVADMAADPAWKIVRLAGTKFAPEAKIMIYWHPDGKHVVLDHAKMKLPVNDQEHQYQLWALVNGKPVDLGVFDMKNGATHLLSNMKEIGMAQTFAVTLEKRGGSLSPTLDQMVAAGNITI